MNSTSLIGFIVAVIILLLVAKWRGVKAKEIQLNRANIPDDVERWQPIVYEVAAERGVPQDVAMGMLWTESAGDPRARGSAGEYGLFQLKEIAVRDLEQMGYGTFPNWKQDPEQNIRAGIAFLHLQYKRTGNWADAVKAYNQGFAGMKQSPGRERAESYLAKVNAKKRFFT